MTGRHLDWSTTPTLSGSANLTLPIEVEPPIGGIGSRLPCGDGDLNGILDPGTLDVDFNAGRAGLLDFEGISFSDIIQAIVKAVEYLATLEKFSFLTQKLPL